MNIKYAIWLILFVLVIVLTTRFLARMDRNIAGDLVSGTSPNLSASLSPLPSFNFVEKNIIVFSPKSGDKVESPFTVTGKARVFENTFVYILRGEKGSELYKNHAIADASDIGQYGNFEVKIPVSVQAVNSNNLTLEVFDYSAKDGSVENLVSIPLEVAVKETMDIDIYLTNTKLDSESTCTKAFQTKRQILKTKEVAYMSLYQLIQGPNMGELSEGYDTDIPGQTAIHSVKIVNGTAYADFDEGLEYGVSGSCRVTMIRSQIENTLKQFSTVKNVVISINGKTEGILQP